jgi:hypothetical protein
MPGYPDVHSFAEFLRKDPRAAGSFRDLYQPGVDEVLNDPERYYENFDPESRPKLEKIVQDLRDNPRTADPTKTYGVGTFFFPGPERGEWFAWYDNGGGPLDTWHYYDPAAGKWYDGQGWHNDMTPEVQDKVDAFAEERPPYEGGPIGAAGGVRNFWDGDSDE